jgi:hypothetical protein
MPPPSSVVVPGSGMGVKLALSSQNVEVCVDVQQPPTYFEVDRRRTWEHLRGLRVRRCS